MNLRTFRDTFVPFATKQRLLAVANPALRLASSRAAVQARLAEPMRRYGIEFLDLGGWAAVEGYLTIHLTSVETYGLPLTPAKTMEIVFDGREGLPRLRGRPLTAPAILMNFNALGGLPLVDGALRGLNLSHFLEHFDLETGRFLLRECRRVLRAGGVGRVSCPDLRKYAAAYLANDVNFFARTGSQVFCNYSGLPTPGAIVAGKAYDGTNGHKWFYDAATVEALLREAGFSSAVECGVHQSALPRITDVEPAHRAIESFYVEAVA